MAGFVRPPAWNRTAGFVHMAPAAFPSIPAQPFGMANQRKVSAYDDEHRNWQIAGQHIHHQVGGPLRRDLRQPALFQRTSQSSPSVQILLSDGRRLGARWRNRGSSVTAHRTPGKSREDHVAQVRPVHGQSSRNQRRMPVHGSGCRDYGKHRLFLRLHAGQTLHHPQLGTTTPCLQKTSGHRQFFHISMACEHHAVRSGQVLLRERLGVDQFQASSSLSHLRSR